ncbi:MAG TPA: hypothetical protein VMV94_00605 [Phycisphaerae bacterium]|nr:hypothetical protein [Phycisphaerae bacterium]
MAQLHWLRVSVKNGTIGNVSTTAAKLNGRPLTSLAMITQPGELTFVADVPRRPGKPSATDGFKTQSGRDLDLVLADSRVPGQQQTVSGRITGIVSDPSVAGHDYQEVTFVFHKID